MFAKGYSSLYVSVERVNMIVTLKQFYRGVGKPAYQDRLG